MLRFDMAVEAANKETAAKLGTSAVMGVSSDSQHAAIKLMFGDGVSAPARYTARVNIMLSCYGALAKDGIMSCASPFCEKDHVQSKGTLRDWCYGEEVIVKYGRVGLAAMLSPSVLLFVPRSRHAAKILLAGISASDLVCAPLKTDINLDTVDLAILETSRHVFDLTVDLEDDMISLCGDELGFYKAAVKAVWYETAASSYPEFSGIDIVVGATEPACKIFFPGDFKAANAFAVALRVDLGVVVHGI